MSSIVEDQDHKYDVGDIVLAPFPFVEKEFFKLRPAAIFSKLDHGVYLVAYITSIKIDKKSTYDVICTPSPENNLQTISCIRTNRLTLVPEKVITRKLGELSKSERESVYEKIVLIGKGILNT